MNNKEGSDHQENRDRDSLQVLLQVDGLLLCADASLDRTGDGERNVSHESKPNEESVSGDS